MWSAVRKSQRCFKSMKLKDGDLNSFSDHRFGTLISGMLILLSGFLSSICKIRFCSSALILGLKRKQNDDLGKRFVTHTFPSRLEDSTATPCSPEQVILWLYLTWDTQQEQHEIMTVLLSCIKPCLLTCKRSFTHFLDSLRKKTSSKTNQNFYSQLEDLVTWSLNTGSASNCQQVVTCWTKWSQQKYFGPFV